MNVKHRHSYYSYDVNDRRIYQFISWELRMARPPDEFSWARGYWHWNGRQYVAMHGHWEAERPGYHYVHPHYERHNDGWHLNVGVWVAG